MYLHNAVDHGSPQLSTNPEKCFKNVKAPGERSLNAIHFYKHMIKFQRLSWLSVSIKSLFPNLKCRLTLGITLSKSHLKIILKKKKSFPT